MRKKILFQKNDGISFHETTLEQRREIHRLMEKRGFAVAVTTKSRDKHYKNGLPSIWNAHFAFEFERMEWRAVSTDSQHEKSITFYPYEWWLEKLAFVIDNSAISSKDTILDEQLRIYHTKTYDYDSQ